MVKQVFRVTDMHCSNCVMRIEGLEDDLLGVQRVRASYKKQQVEVEYDDNQVSVDSNHRGDPAARLHRRLRTPRLTPYSAAGQPRRCCPAANAPNDASPSRYTALFASGSDVYTVNRCQTSRPIPRKLKRMCWMPSPCSSRYSVSELGPAPAPAPQISISIGPRLAKPIRWAKWPGSPENLPSFVSQAAPPRQFDTALPHGYTSRNVSQTPV